MKKVLLILILIFIVLTNINAAKLKVGTNAEYAPFEFYTKEGIMTGFDIDLMNSIASEAGYDGVEWKDMTFDGLIQSLTTKKEIDVIAAGLVITEERKQKVLYTKSYVNEALIIVVKKDKADLKTLKDLEGKKIGAEIGTTSATLAKTVKKAKVIELSTADVFTHLKEGKVDAIIQTESVARYAITSGGLPLKVTSENLLATKKTNQIALAVDKKNVDLQKKLDAAMVSIRKKGVFDKIYQKWFGN
ncbi:MAG: transporter substrate-binding domain-containing protein [Rickettsiales bacterium]|jgi:polar amino acid transport system substrate-binding protein|nr:transporter substrate-binding domain-containing protein [Rickettsiales bacterium]